MQKDIYESNKNYRKSYTLLARGSFYFCLTFSSLRGAKCTNYELEYRNTEARKMILPLVIPQNAECLLEMTNAFPHIYGQMKLHKGGSPMRLVMPFSKHPPSSAPLELPEGRGI